MQKATTPKRYYIDHTSVDQKVEVRAVSCPWPQKREHAAIETRQSSTEAERLLSTSRLIRGGFLRKK
ncbi:MAG: hypothetical protein M9953_09955 [Thermomicrobiales bacterium]|nr:hypothetical protein [Thermomicrobiales bacterium]MCO5218596.1 hypothetical protein [Thermomicrobiales bacterium]MCO5225652.1 hypothetical protein [Thermomicrobiales bacterium]MCO5229254.1 hypothetical protein [Thermomicrobiales bacterium]